ncbi:MAG: T9SS type A sorting domain-containing protein [Bacteroidota bacterium]
MKNKLRFTRSLALVAIVILMMMPGKGWGQLSIATSGTQYTVDFSTTTSGVNNGSFAAAATFSGTTPSSGQLDSDAWAFVNDGASAPTTSVSTFATAGTGGLGTSTGAVSSGGWYAFNCGSGNPAFGFQPSGSFCTAGMITMKMTNNTGSSINSIDISYTAWYYNDQGVGTDLQFFYSSDNTTYTDAGITLTTPTTAAGSPTWTSTTKTKSITLLNIANGGSFYLRWYTLDNGGTGSRDELAIDDIKITGNGITATNYYSKSTGNLDNVANWGTVTDGSGTAPLGFTADNQIFNIRNNATPTIGADWTVSGAGSKIITGDGANACNFTIPSSFKVTGTIDVAASATLTIANTTNYPTLGALTGTVAYTGASAQTIAAATYGSLSISTTGGNATAGGAIGVTTALTVASGSTLDMGSANLLSGAFTATSGTGTLKTAVPTATSATPIPTAKTWTMDVLYNSASPQTVVAGNYNNLDISGGNRTLISGGIIAIAGTYTPGAGTLTVSNNTISFNGSSPQNLPAATYNNVVIANSAGVTISANTQVIGGTTTLTSGALILPTGASNLVTFSGAISATSGTITGSSTSNISTATISTSFAFTSGGQSLNNWSVNGAIGSSTTIGLSTPVTINGTLTHNGATDIWSTSAGAITIVSGATYDEISSGWYRGAGAITINSGASFKINGSGGLTAATAQGVVQVTGARSFSGGANYTFNNSSSQSIGDALDAAGGAGKTGVITGNVVVSGNSSGLTLNSGTTITINSPGSFTLGTGSSSSLLIAPAASVINGTGNVSFLGNGATSGSSLTTAHANGVSGTIQSSGTISLTNGSNNNTNFTFNGSVAQVTGSLLPATVNNLTFINTFSGSVASPSITLSSSTNVNGTTTMAGGTAPLGLIGIGAGNTLTLNGVVTMTNANKLVGTSTSNLIIGGSGALGSTLFAASGGGVVQDFTMNRATYTATIGTTLTVGGAFNLTNGVLAMSTNTLTLNGAITFGSGTLTATGPLTIGGSGSITGNLTGTSTPLALSILTINRSGANLPLATNVTLSSATAPLVLTAGNITLGAYNLTATSSASTATLGTGSSSSMIVATSATIGKAYVTITTGASGLRTFPVGDGTNYTPVTLSFSANAIGGTIGVNVTATAHTSLNLTGNPQADYISRYWSFTTTGLSNYTYSSTFTYVPGDITGDQTLMKLNRYTGSVWVEDATSSAAANVLTSTTGLTQVTGLLNGNDFTGRKEPNPVSYVWNGSTSNDWATPSNWTPSGTPGTIDNITVNVPGSFTNCSINSGSKTVASLTINGTGAFVMASGASLSVTGAVTYDGSGGATATLDCGSTFNYSGVSSQTVAALNYGNLNLTGGARVLASTGTIGICGTFTQGAGGFTNTGSTIDFNGSGSQTIPAFTYNNLTSSSSGARTLAGSGSVAVAGTFTPGSNTYTITGSTIDFSNSGSQTIPAFNYNIITNTGGGARVLASSGTVGIASTFAPGAGAYTVGGSSIDYNGTSGFTMSTFTYNNLTISGNKGSGTVSFGSGTITIGGVLSYTATNATQTAGSGTVVFNSASSQTIPALNYFNLTLTGGARELASSGTIGIAGPTFTPGSGPFTVTGSTVNFSNSTGFAIPALTPAATYNYNNLTISGGTAYTLAANTTISGNYTQNAGTFTVTPGASAFTLTVGGNFIQTAGTFNVTGGSATAGATVTVTGSTSVFSINMSPNSGNAASLLLPSPTNTILFQANGDATFTGSNTTTAFDWMAGGNSGSIYNITFGIKGNFNWSNATGRPYTTGSGMAKGFVFNGAGTLIVPQTLNYGGSTTTLTSIYGMIFSVNSGTVVKLLSGVAIGAATGPYNTFTVNGTLDAQSSVISGGNATVAANNTGFTLASDATLMTKLATGINGTVTTALKNFSSTASYVFNGTADQVTGALLTTAKNIDLANTGGKVSLSNGIAVSGTVTVPASNKLGVSTYAITGAGNFNLQSGGTLYTANTAGINGSIGVAGTKTFDPAANYVFNGAADQVAGALLTAANNIDLANTVGKVALSGNVALSGTLTIPTGNKLDAASYVISGAGDIDLQGGGAFISSHNSGLNGNIAASGVLSTYSTSANYTFNGSSAQVAGALLPATVNNLTIDNAAGVKLSNIALTVAGTMLINSGKLFTLESGKQLTVSGTLTNSATASGLVIESDASLLHNTASVAATVKRNIPAWGSTMVGWHLLSSPVASQGFQSNFVSSPPSANEDFFLWKETTNEWINSKVGASAPYTFNTADFGSSFVIGQGYLVSYSATSDKVFSGSLNVANVPLTLSYTDAGRKGWNLLGNPFACGLKWNVTTWGAINVGGVAKIMKSTDGSYQDISADEYIPAMNGFFVKTSVDATSITIPATERGHSGTWLKSSDIQHFALTARDLDGQTAQSSDIRINPESTAGFDLLYDGEFAPFYAPQFYSVVGSDKLSTNSIPEITDETVIPMGFVKNNGNNFRIEAQGIETFQPATAVYLWDNKLGIKQNLAVNPVYAFTSATGDAAARFELHFKNATSVPDPASKENFSVYQNNGNLNVVTPEASNTEIRVTNMIGQVVLRGNTGGNTQTLLNANKLQNGVYVVSLISGSKVVSTKIVVSR